MDENEPCHLKEKFQCNTLIFHQRSELKQHGFHDRIFQESPTEDIVSYVLQSLPKTSRDAFLEVFRMRQK